MSATFDVLGLGAVAVDELIYVDCYPAADEKAQVLRTECQCGGLTATALVAAARFGAKCAYAGVLGSDELSLFARDAMAKEGISLDHLLVKAEAHPVHSYIIVGEAGCTRNIFADSRNAVGADPNWPPAELIRGSRVLFVDHFGMAGMLRASRIAREAGIPVVADLERDGGPEFGELFKIVDHLVISFSFARSLTRAVDPGEAVEKLWTAQRDAVVVTDGAKGCSFRSKDASRVEHQPAFKVKAIDTTGCGDVFHGVYTAALAKGLPVADRVRLASAAAALKATKPGGQEGIPDRRELEQFVGGRSLS